MRFSTWPGAVGSVLLLSVVAFASRSTALERSAQVAPDLPDWSSGTTCSLAYFNFCNGWVWTWGLHYQDRFGVVFDRCADGCTLDSSQILFFFNSSTGRGFTGTLGIYAVDGNDCPVGEPIATQALLPRDGWRTTVWGGISVPDPFAVVMRMPEWGLPIPSVIVTDHPGRGPTGAAACGTCYPETRENRSYRWTWAGDSFCPGQRFTPHNEAICDPQLLMVAHMSCSTDVQSDSWGRLKGLFR